MTSAQSPVAVIVAAFNEEKYIRDTLRALDAQRFDTPFERDALDGFRVVVVDNASTDGTADAVRAHIESGTRFPVELITETEKGTGYAVDTATRHAIDTGAVLIARTDADTLPEPDWLHELLKPLYEGKHLVGGRLRARTDEGVVNTIFNAIGHGWRLGHAVEWYNTRKEPPENRRSFAVCGPNMAFDAEIYRRSGGFPRVAIDELDEDLTFERRVRAVTGKKGVALAPKAVVRISLRRLHHLGVRDFMAWYGEKNRDTTGKTVDIR